MLWTHVGNEDLAVHFQPALHILARGKDLVLAVPHVAPEQVGLGWACRNSHTTWRRSSKRNGKRQRACFEPCSSTGSCRKRLSPSNWSYRSGFVSKVVFSRKPCQSWYIIDQLHPSLSGCSGNVFQRSLA